MPPIRRIHIIGRKNSGKTTLVESLVAHFSERGVRVGTVKHTHHRHELDLPGKDSYRHRAAGAAVSAIVSPAMTAVFRPCSPQSDASQQYELMAPLFSDCDLLLVEGHSRVEGLKLEVWRAGVGARPIADEGCGVLAVITDDPLAVNVPIWPRSDVAALATRIRELIESAAGVDGRPTTQP